MRRGARGRARPGGGRGGSHVRDTQPRVVAGRVSTGLRAGSPFDRTRIRGLRERVWELWRVDLAGHVVRLTARPLFAFQTAWSPDGATIALATSGGGIYGVDRDGSDFRRLHAARGARRGLPTARSFSRRCRSPSSTLRPERRDRLRSDGRRPGPTTAPSSRSPTATGSSLGHPPPRRPGSSDRAASASPRYLRAATGSRLCAGNACGSSIAPADERSCSSGRTPDTMRLAGRFEDSAPSSQPGPADGARRSTSCVRTGPGGAFSFVRSRSCVLAAPVMAPWPD